ncbi:lytic transglycosylase domain-containing protein [Chondromyces apiculatus]|uniref:Lytic transglycosylase n=1 Tax=Chondromyces apiculatus DSM 436 TaxID=1192034 RepID=A0A017T8D5_9BACT|nr:lytic transglycosylase domain-containing protein [Chondromyces apiculatus]EYF05035.1 lytic transglycosylase [Chondromyces apiculatus DSM 436]
MAAGSGLVGSAVLLGEGHAAAEVVRYVDREGKVHEVTVTAEASASEASASEAPAGQAAPATQAAAAAQAAWSAGRGGAAPATTLATTGASSPGAGTMDGFPYAAPVREAAKLYSLPVELILAVMQVESGFDARAVSRAGAQGLMQLMPATAVEVGVRDPFDPRQNVLGGARYLRILLNAHDGSVTLALAAYHAGAGAVERHGGVPPYPETQRYVVSVRRLYHWYKASGTAVGAGTIRAK